MMEEQWVLVVKSHKHSVKRVRAIYGVFRSYEHAINWATQRRNTPEWEGLTFRPRRLLGIHE